MADVEHAARLLGINFTIQLVPAGGGKVMHVLAGQSDAVRQRGQELYQAAWDRPPAPQASLVVATIEGGAGPADVGERGPGIASGGTFCRGGRRDRRLLRSVGARPARACNAWQAVRRARQPCGTWARSGRPMP